MGKRDYFFLLASVAIPACGGRTELDGLSPDSGGTIHSGGTTSTGGSAGTGCTGNFEEIQSNTGLCVAKMATIIAPIGYADYKIDVTEVTQGQYDTWLATTPALPARTDANCGYVTSYAQQGTDGVFAGTDADHHPVVYVDWCDAYAYCLGVGKRLCGAIGGGSNQGANNDPTRSQWFRACSAGGTHLYPYGNTYQPSFCDGWDYWDDNSATMQTVPVGSLLNCVTSTPGYAGVYDLSGNVGEWADSCEGAGRSAFCPHGGSFFNSGYYLTCAYDFNSTRDGVTFDVGFRCCAP